MAKPYTFTEQCKANGVDPLEQIIAAVERTGSVAAAAGDLGISISTAHHWLRMAGIRPTVRRKTVLKRAK